MSCFNVKKSYQQAAIPMAQNPNPPVGFVMPTGPHQQQPGYPPAQPYYPPAPQAGYPHPQAGYPPPQAGYPPPQAAYPQPQFNHQPFPPPIQQAPGFGQPASHIQQWWSSTTFHQFLTGASSFHVKQKVELLEAIAGWETENKYTIKDQLGNKILYAGEESDCFSRQFCGPNRAFSMRLKDTRGQDVIRYERSLNCSCCCGLFCPDEFDVNTANGIKLGSVRQEFSLIFPTFKLKDAAGNTQLKIEGPFCPMSVACGPVNFRVTNKKGVTIGTVSKEWGGLVRELFTDADYFSISFPHDLDNSMKAVCIAALFMIDFQYFESSARKKGIFN